MQTKQRDSIVRHAHIIDELSLQYQTHFEPYLNMIEEADDHHDDTHDKKILRIHAWNELIDTAHVHDQLWYAPGQSIEYKMKIFEIAKPGKVPRMIGDLGVHASLQGFRLTKFLKMAMASEPLHYLGGEIEFCPKPNPVDLARVFQKLIDPPGRYYFVYFSDDACLSIRTPNGILRANLDISSCDASHTHELFLLLKNLLPPHMRTDLQRLIDQCNEPITIYSRIDKRRKVVLKPEASRLWSGSTITTAINNLANILNMLEIADRTIYSAADIVAACGAAGYIVTVENCDDWHRLQFLKHSPVLDTNGNLRALLNIGVILRLSGTCKGDLPGRSSQPLRDRARAFQASLVQGVSPHARHRLIHNMRAHSGLPTPETDKVVRKMLEYKTELVDQEEFTVPEEEVYARYHNYFPDTPFEDGDQSDIAEIFGSCEYTEHYHSRATNIILKADYGLTGAEFE